MPSKQQPASHKQKAEDVLVPMLSDESDDMKKLFNTVIKTYLSVQPEAVSSKIRQADLQKLIIEAAERINSTTTNDEGCE